jgi:hypothetical protein
MSEWVHINGCIRVNALRNSFDETYIGTIRGIMGETWSEDLEMRGDETHLPIGIVYEIHENPDWNCNAAYAIPFWGDIPSIYAHRDAIEIKIWFSKVIKDFEAFSEIPKNYGNLNIRNAVLQLYIEHTKEEIILTDRILQPFINK